MKEQQPNCDLEIWTTLNCNMKCSICFFGNPPADFKIHEPTIEAIENFAINDKHPFYCLTGAESTSRDDLADIIRILKKHKKGVTLNTNGIKLANENYFLQLKNAGLDRVILQFDGFDPKISNTLRGNDITEQKKKILLNLQNSQMPTVLNSTIAHNVNEHTVKELIDYALEKPFINGVTFLTISFDGGAREWKQSEYIMPDEVIDIVCKSTSYKVKKENVYRFQKLHFALKAFLKQRACLYNQLFVLVRNKASFEPIDAFLNLSLAEPWLDKYANSYKKNSLFSSIFLGIAIVMLCMNFRIFILLIELIVSGLSFYFRTSSYLRTNKLLALSFTTGCDPYKLDNDILKNCQNEIIAADNNIHSVRNLGLEGAYIVALEKRFKDQKANEL
ncbi:MAG: radical SAM protein [Candidatus Omnitrophica bacterium]|nr:radical SAM protein [Candidatus Omnitrophota bacterium]